MVINILGAEYNVIFKNREDDIKLSEVDGYCDTTIKEIVVGNFKYDTMSLANLYKFQTKILRHEILHAFLYESGLSCCPEWAVNEEMIDFFAIQLPKIFKAFNEADLL